MKITVETIQKMHCEGSKIVMLTCYDASFARVMDEAGIDILLVGDSLGMVIQNHSSTLAVSLDEMVYHTRCVARGADKALIAVDMPFGSYQHNPAQAFASAACLMQAGAHMVKLEGGSFLADTIRFLVERGIPVCAHIGLTPQFVNVFGGFKVQGMTDDAANILLADAKNLAQAGAALIVLECIPAVLAKRITESIAIPTIGIGAGCNVSGQVLVVYDMLGIWAGKKMRFVENFMEGAASIQDAISAYIGAVRQGAFPTDEHSF